MARPKKQAPSQRKSIPRVAGLETEYGCLTSEHLKTHEVLQRIRDWIFEENRYGLIDLHHRDWDEPAGNGGFLFNGGRFYIDMGHIEYCTPECLTAREVVLYDRAGDIILNHAIDELGYRGQVTFIRNNIDHYTGATFGCHENFSMERAAPFTEANVLSLLAFLTLRVLMIGSGCVGSIQARRQSGDPRKHGGYQISQRADFIQNDFYEWVQQNRAIINTRDEPLADANKFRRLHLLHGDTTVLPATQFLKIGSTRMVLELLELDDLPRVELQNATGTLRRLSHNLNPPWEVELAGAETGDALELLRLYYERGQKRFSGRDQETDAILQLWDRSLRALGGDRSELVGLIDWVTKETLLESFRAQEKLDWSDPWLEAQDLEFHNINPEAGLGLAMADESGFWNTEDAREAMLQPPPKTRANARSVMMHEVKDTGKTYIIDWDGVGAYKEPMRHLRDPFQHTPPEPDPEGRPMFPLE
jgi:proteasome accessory factor A